MKAMGEKFKIGAFNLDDVELHEQGINRVGNLLITNESYMNLETQMTEILKELYAKKNRWTVSDMIREIGLKIKELR